MACNPCGEFSSPTNPDKGQCAPLRTKVDCGNPPLPTPQCGEIFTLTYDPDSPIRFKASSHVFDTNCGVLLDTLNQPIFGVLT